MVSGAARSSNSDLPVAPRTGSYNTQLPVDIAPDSGSNGGKPDTKSRRKVLRSPLGRATFFERFVHPVQTRPSLVLTSIIYSTEPPS